MIGTVNIVFDAGMAHLICGVMVLLLIFSALPAFVFNKLMQKRRNKKEFTLIQDKVEGLQRELEAAHRRNRNLHEIIRNKIKKDCNGLITNDEVDKEVRHIQDLLDLADETNVKIQEAESKVETFGSENQKLRKEAEDNEKALAEYRKQIVQLKELNLTLEKDLFENKRHIQDLENINVAKEKELSQKNRHIECLEGRNLAMKTDLTEKTLQIQGLEDVKLAMENELSDVKRQIQGLEDTNMAMKTELTEKNRHIECLEGRNMAMENELSEVKRHIQGLEVTNRAKEETLCEKERQIEEMTKKNALKEEQLEDYHRLLDELQKEIGMLESKARDFDALESQNRRNEQNLLAWEQQIENLQKKLQERNEEVNKLVQCEMEVEILRKELEDRQKDLSKLVQYEREVEQSRKELEDRRKDVNKLVCCEQELEQLRKELEDKEKYINKLVPYEMEFECLRKEYEAKQVALVEMAGLIERDERVIFDLQRKVEELGGEIKDRNKERDGLLTSEAVLVQNLAKSELYISELKTEVEMLRSQKAELVNQLEENMSHLKSKQSQILDLEQKLLNMEGYQEEKDNLEKVIKEKEKEIEHFKREREDNLKEAQDLRILIALREENLQECQQEKELLLKELEKSQKDLEELVCWNLRKEEEDIEKMAEQFHQLEFMRSQFQEMVDAYENKTSEQEMEITCLRKEVQQKNNLLEEGIAQRDNLEKVIKEKEKEIEHFKREREDNLKETQDLRILIALREENLQECQQEKELLLKELEKSQKDLEELVCWNLRKEEEDIKKMAEQFHQLEFMRSQFQEMVDAYENKTSEQEMEITCLCKEVQQKNNLLEEGIAQRDNLEKVIKEKEKEIEHFKREREDNLKETQDLRIQIALRDKDLQKCEEELENWQKESEELVCWKLRQEEFIESQFQEMEDAYEKKISEQEKEITCLCKEVQQKNNLLEEGIAQRDNLKQKLECVEMENSHLKQLAAEAEERQIAAEGALKELSINIQRIEKLVTDKQREVDELRSKLEEKNTENDKLVQCKEEVEVLRKELKKKDLEIRKGKEEAKQHGKQMESVGARLQEMVAAFNKIT